MSWLYHGFNLDKDKRRTQCWKEWHCVYCYIRTIWAITKYSARAKAFFLLITATGIIATLTFAWWLLGVLRP